MSLKGDSCNKEEEEEEREIYAKLSVTLATKKGILVATAHSIHGTKTPTGPRTPHKAEK